MLSCSLGTVAAALVPLILDAYGLSGPALWVASSYVFLIAGAAVTLMMATLTFQLTPAERKELGPLHLVVSYGLGACTFGLLVWNVAMTPLVGNYVLAISLMFVVAVIGFTTFSLQKILHW